MDKELVAEGAAVVFVLILGIAFGCVVGGVSEMNHQHAEAIKAGVGEYYLDANNDKQFRFVGGKGK